MEINTLVLFVIAALSINLIPGPDVIYIVTNTMKGKMKSGIKASLGLGVGYLIHTLAAVLGLSALILSSAFLFAIIKYLGAAYLLYLGVISIINCYRNNSKICVEISDEKQSNVFKQGAIVSVLNPKVAMFFLAFLPQFIDPTGVNATSELLTLGLLFSLLATCCNLFYASLGSILFSSPKAQKYSRTLEGVSGTILIGLSAKIALSSNK
ncbi:MULTISPECIES: LysE family translocator [unclassified Photobacterium]|uniref:LysE family translocator n=1 Tax=unclassified Photobacterium TaxID=2628852 RepID=UPI000D16433F|nr:MULTISPECIES: LysE family translocator [unclassified Photobacterium]PSV26248.1 LysE family translocator [Photobacterium sp. GB-56]PSV26801.1 LysE family translocator [Photobacterium sp. GB-72]PSV34351.1 LysE family translocator [Photobacterium sp. GB-210]PSV52253.1 LysE family translocator [Photobacterium sp. GB-1]